MWLKLYIDPNKYGFVKIRIKYRIKFKLEFALKYLNMLQLKFRSKIEKNGKEINSLYHQTVIELCSLYSVSHTSLVSLAMVSSSLVGITRTLTFESGVLMSIS